MIKKISVLFVFQLVFMHGILLAQFYPLDSTFGVNGKTIVNITSMSFEANHISTQSDGKIILATSKLDSNNDCDFCLLRFNSDGTIDNTFGDQGMMVADLGSPDDFPFDVAVQTDDKILVVGTSGVLADRDFTIVRFNANGTLDQNFGTNGITKTNILYDDIFFAVGLQADGKIVVGGTSNAKGYIYRFLTDGTIDNSFGNAGKISLIYAEITYILDIFILANGSILAAGQIGGDFSDSFVAKINSDGSVNTSFGSNGKYIVNFGNEEFINTLSCQSDGKILLGGTSGTMVGSEPIFDFLIVRLSPEGVLDNTFNNSGKLLFRFSINSALNVCNAIISNSNDDIFTVGFTGNLQQTNSHIAVAKLTPNGTLDVTFGNNGKVISNFGSLREQGQGVFIDMDDGLLVSGIYGDDINPLICRYKTSIVDDINEQSKVNDIINIFPNPCKDYVTVELKSIPEHAVEISMYDMSGREIYRNTPIHFFKPSINVPTDFLPEGIYQIQIKSGNMILSKKLIKHF